MTREMLYAEERLLAKKRKVCALIAKENYTFMCRLACFVKTPYRTFVETLFKPLKEYAVYHLTPE